jgi:hypothetical protein
MWKLLRNLVIVAVLLVAVLKLVLWYETQQGASRLITRLAPYAQVQIGSVSSSLDGSVELSGVNATIGKGAARENWRATQVALTTPGALWLLRRLLFGDESLPEQLGVTLKGLQAPAAVLGVGADAAWLSPLSLVPFETMGCGVVSRFSVADYQRMGLNPGAPQQHLEYRYDATGHALTFAAEFASPPFSTVSVRGELQKFDPRGVASGTWQQLHVSEVSVGYLDGGYLLKRNRFCAQQAGISPAQFVDQHLSAVAAFLSDRGVQPGAQVEAIYRSLVTEGGRVSVLSLPPAASSIDQLLGETADVMTRQLNLTARRNDAPPVMVRLAFHPVNDVPSAATAAETSATGAGETGKPATAPVVPVAATPPLKAAPITAAVTAATPPKPAPVPTPPPKAVPTASAATATVPQKPAPLPTPLTAKPAMPPPAPPVAVTKLPTPAPVAARPAGVVTDPPVAKAPTPTPATPASTTGPKPQGADTASTQASGPPPEAGSTLALVWKPGVEDRLQAPAPAKRDYDVIEFSALSGYSGRFVRLLTTTGKKVEGRIVGVDGTSVGVRIHTAGGTAELQIPRSVIFEIQLPHGRSADSNG